MLKPALRWFGASFSAPRWCLAAAALSFAATVTLYRYVDAAWLLNVQLSAQEVAMMIFRSPVNAGFIGLPLYLFLVCGIPGDLGSGRQALLLCGSRARVYTLLKTRLALATGAFVLLMAAVAGAVALGVFPPSAHWSADYLAWRVMQGQSALAFTLPPALALALQLLCRSAAFWLAGCVCLLCGLIWRQEALALALALVCGLPCCLPEPALFGRFHLAGGLALFAALLALSALPLWGVRRHLARADLGEVEP